MQYESYLKKYARNLRSTMTDAELRIWKYIRRKQLHNIQFYRQRPIENYIVDFVSFDPKVIIEIDGGQHFEELNKIKDKERDKRLQQVGFTVIRYDDHVVLTNTEGVLTDLDTIISSSYSRPNPS